MRAALAFVIVAPFATWLVSASAAHPTLVTLVPFPFERIGALIFVLIAGGLALGEILGRRNRRLRIAQESSLQRSRSPRRSLDSIRFPGLHQACFSR